MLVAVAIPGITFAQLVPSSADVSRLSQNLQKPTVAPKTVGGVATPHMQKFQATPGADKVQFDLKRINLEGNTVYSYQELAPLFQGYVGHKTSLAGLESVAHEITLKYRSAGYVLSRAIIPAQTIKNGTVTIQVIEGYVGNVAPVGYVQGAGPLLNKYGQKIAQSKPLNINTLERYALLANDIPGMNQVKVVLQPPGPRAPLGSTNLAFAPDFSKASGFVTYDNRGTKYLGQNEFSVGGTVNSLIQSGDQLGVQALTSNNINEEYFNVFDLQPIGATGSTFNLSGSFSKTTPGFIITPLKVVGISREVVATVRVPVIRSRKQNLYTNLSFDYLNSKTQFYNVNPPLVLYNDHVRSLRLGVDYFLQDSLAGADQISGQISHGINVLGASPRNFTPSTPPPIILGYSRLQGDPQYTKFNGTLSRLQGVTQNISVLVAGIGQYTNQPLLSSEQFAFGGAQYGQAYDPAEITGDKGVAAKAELRYNVNPNYRFLNSAQYYAFYDIGKIWNVLPVGLTGIQQVQSAASTGVGVRVNFNPYVYGSAVFADPLTRKVATNNSTAPRIFVSLTLTGKTPSATDQGSLPGIDRPPVGYSGGEATNGPNAQARAATGI